MAQFDWQTEEEAWSDEPEVAAQPGRPARRWPRWLLLLLLVATAVAFAVRQTENHLAATNDTISQEVIASHRLIRAAAAEGDVELLRAYLSGRDTSWTAAVQILVERGERFDHRALGLERVSAPAGTVVDVQLNPELTEAQVVSEHRYRQRSDRTDGRTLTLRETSVYRLGPDRWLWAPAPAATEAPRQAYRHPRFVLFCPPEDAAFCRDLGDAFTRLLERYCGQTIAGCDMHLRVYLDSRLNRLGTLYGSRKLLDRNGRIDLPAPAIVGRPVNDEARAALLDGYRLLLLTPFIAGNVDYVCCQHSLFVQAYRAWELARLGYEPWPLAPGDYAVLFDSGTTLSDVVRPWLASTSVLSPEINDDTRSIYALAEFLLTLPEVEHRVLLRELSVTNNYWDWLTSVIGPTLTPDSEIEYAWRQFLARQLNATTGTLPIPLPDQSLVAICLTDDGQDSRLQEYNWRADSWEERYALGDAFAYLSPAPSDQAVIWQEMSLPTDGFLYVTRWMPGVEPQTMRVTRSSQTRFAGYYGLVDPTGRYVVLYTLDTAGTAVQLRLMDTAACGDGPCSAWNISGVPTWSPDGRHTLLKGGLQLNARPPTLWNGPLWLADSRGQEPQRLVSGAAPFWLDSERFGYIAPSGDVVVARPEDPDRATLLLEGRRLLAMLTRIDGFEAVSRADVLVPPGENNVLYLRFVGHNRVQYLLEFDITHDRLTSLLETPIYTAGLQFSTDGRFVTTVEAGRRLTGRNQLFLLDRQTGNRRTYSVFGSYPGRGYDWSADGQWLAIVDDGSIEIVAPGYDYRHIIFHEFQRCNSIAWVDDQSVD